MDNSTFLDSEELLLNVEDDFNADQLVPSRQNLTSVSRQNFSSFLEAVRNSDHTRSNFVSLSVILTFIYRTKKSRSNFFYRKTNVMLIFMIICNCQGSKCFRNQGV